MRSGTEISIVWGSKEAMGECDAVGRYAMALAMPLFDERVAGLLAELHGLVTHLTSLVLVDEVGEKSQGLPQTVKVALPVAHATGVRMMVRPNISKERSVMPRSYNAASPPASMMLDMDTSPPRLEMSARRDSSSSIEPNSEKISLSSADRNRVGRHIEERKVSDELIFNSLAEMLDSFENISVEWDEVALNLNNDIWYWPAELVNFIEQSKTVPEIVELAMKLGLTVQLLLVMHLAKRDENDHRNAARVYRNIISTLDQRFERLIVVQQSELKLS
jgi:hypothetical protein